MAYYMPRVYTKIVIQQLTDSAVRTANGALLRIEFDFCHSWECDETWINLTNKGKLTIPKNVYVIDGNTTGAKKNLYGSQNASQLIANLFMRGDSVTINTGYYMYDTAGNETLDQTQVFSGFITQVGSKMPIELELEDNMWLLKQIPCTPQVWPRTKTVEELMNSLLSGATSNGNPITVNALTETTIGDFVILNESVAQVLQRLRKDYHLEAYFGTAAPINGVAQPAGCELRIGSVVYIPPNPLPTQVPLFQFQNNIISDELVYQRVDDVKLSAVCESINTVFTGKTNKQGQKKSTQQRLTVLVWYGINLKTGTNQWQYMVKQKNVELPANEEGERRTLFFHFGLQDSGLITITDAFTLAQAGVAELAKFYYTGFKGKFTTFAVPDINVGDYIKLEDLVLPDRSGFYVVKGVTPKSGGVGGGRQVIELAYSLITNNGTVIVPPLVNPVLSQPPQVALPPGVVGQSNQTPLGDNSEE